MFILSNLLMVPCNLFRPDDIPTFCLLTDHPPQMTTLDYTAMFIYMLVVLAVGAWFSRGERDTETYLLGGRRIAFWLVGISYMMSLLSTNSLVQIPGWAYAKGVTLALGGLIMPVAALTAFYLFVPFYFRQKSFTPFEYLERRFSAPVRLGVSVLYLSTRILYISMVMFSCSKVFQGASGWPPEFTIPIVGLVGVMYTMMGGIRAVVWTDFLQFVVMSIGLVAIMMKITPEVPGGAWGIVEYAFDNGRGMPELATAEFYQFDFYAELTLWTIIISTFSQFMFYNSSEQIAIQRLLTTANWKQAQRSMWMYVLMLIPMMSVLWYLGLAIFSFYGQQPTHLRPTQGDLALFRFIAHELPTPLPGIILSAMLAAVMSTVDSGVNAFATVATKDIYLRFLRPQASESDQVRMSRIMTMVTGMFAIGFALLLSIVASTFNQPVLELDNICHGLVYVLPGIFLLGVMNRRIGHGGVIIAGATGLAAVLGMLVWFYVGKARGQPIGFLYVSATGLLVTFLTGSLISFALPRSSRERLQGLTLWD